ncbi:MAG: hypothetical protein AB7O96_01595 [Pseudobdellovibrionaceae bacterium]
MKKTTPRASALLNFLSRGALVVITGVGSFAQAQDLVLSEAHASQSREIASLGLPRFQVVPSCNNRPEFLNESRVEIYEGLKGVPPGLLVARLAQFYVESNASDGSPIRIHSEQRYVDADSKSPQSRVVCGFANAGIHKSFATYGLTLLDLGSAKKVKPTVWQFQMSANDGKFGVWNHKSEILIANKKSPRDILQSLGGEARIYKLGKSRYEILVIKETEGFKQYFSIVYDLMR